MSCCLEKHRQLACSWHSRCCNAWAHVALSQSAQQQAQGCGFACSKHAPAPSLLARVRTAVLLRRLAQHLGGTLVVLGLRVRPCPVLIVHAGGHRCKQLVLAPLHSGLVNQARLQLLQSQVLLLPIFIPMVCGSEGAYSRQATNFNANFNATSTKCGGSAQQALSSPECGGLWCMLPA
jgi:hypothetical protein